MDLHTFQIEARKTARYPNIGNNLLYPTLGLIGECGELTEKIKKSIRDDGSIITKEKKQAILNETSDICWYLASLCSELKKDFSLTDDRFKEINTLYNCNIYFIILFISQFTGLMAEQVINHQYYYKDSSFEILYYIEKITGLLKIFCNKLDIVFEDVLDFNIKKLTDRLNRGVISGSGDNR